MARISPIGSVTRKRDMEEQDEQWDFLAQSSCHAHVRPGASILTTVTLTFRRVADLAINADGTQDMKAEIQVNVM